jgi:O-antigen ligase
VKGQLTFLLVPAAAALLAGEDDVRLLVNLWRLTALYLVLRGLGEFLSSGGGLDARLRAGLSVHMTYAGLVMVFTLLLLGRALASGEPRASRLFDGAVAAAGILAIGLSLTRNAYLGLTAGVTALVLAKKPRAALVLAPLAFVLFLVVPPSVRNRALSTFDPADETVRDRLAMWKAGELMIRDHPWTGVGPGRVGPLYHEYRQPGHVMPQIGHLHDNLVHLAAETGIPSAVFYLGFVGAFFAGAVRRLRQPGPDPLRPVVEGAVAAMAGLFAAGFFEYNFGDVEVLVPTLVLSVIPFVRSGRPRAGG